MPIFQNRNRINLSFQLCKNRHKYSPLLLLQLILIPHNTVIVSHNHFIQISRLLSIRRQLKSPYNLPTPISDSAHLTHHPYYNTSKLTRNTNLLNNQLHHPHLHVNCQNTAIAKLTSSLWKTPKKCKKLYKNSIDISTLVIYYRDSF